MPICFQTRHDYPAKRRKHMDVYFHVLFKDYNPFQIQVYQLPYLRQLTGGKQLSCSSIVVSYVMGKLIVIAEYVPAPKERRVLLNTILFIFLNHLFVLRYLLFSRFGKVSGQSGCTRLCLKARRSLQQSWQCFA